MPSISSLKKLPKKIKGGFNQNYLKYLDLPVNEKLVLLEGGQGKNINGNMFSMLREICKNPKYTDYTCVFTVTENTLSKAEKRMSFYGFDRVILAVRNSNEYKKYLATAKYLMTDNSFPPYFFKRGEQVFLNTWHGTPLKTLGMSDKSNPASLANIQKNFLMSDIALFPNEFTKNVFFEDYDIKNIFKGKSLIAPYPRNYVFYDNEQRAQMKKILGIEDKQVFAYMPTWRGTGRSADTENQLEITKRILDEFDSLLGDNQLLLVNFHFLLSSSIDCTEYKHIKYFSPDYDTYEVLNACDGLVTDYSSVFFDFAITGKKVILFAYDKIDYMSDRGVYMPFESLPFPITQTVEQTVKEMDKPLKPYPDFMRKYCPDGSKNICSEIFDLMLGETTDLLSRKNLPDEKPLCLLYLGRMPECDFDSVRKYIDSNPQYKFVLAYSGNFNEKNKAFLLSLSDKADSLGLVTAPLFYNGETFKLLKNIIKGKDFDKLNSLFEREAKRIFYSVKPERVVDFVCDNAFVSGVLSCLSGDKEYIEHGSYHKISRTKQSLTRNIKSFELSKGFLPNENYNISSDDSVCADTYSKNAFLTPRAPLYLALGNKLKAVSFFKISGITPFTCADLAFYTDDKMLKSHFYINKKKMSKKHFGIFTLSVSKDELKTMESANLIKAVFFDSLGHNVTAKVYYNSFFLKRTFGLRSAIMRDRRDNTAAVFRQMTGNELGIYYRPYLRGDRIIEHIKVAVAFVLSFVKKGNNVILLYEKDGAKYEESASVTYEKLIDNGYDNAYFVIDRDYKYLSRIPEKYRKNLLYKYSFKHYLNFFRAKSFIGTEQPVHAFELKTFNPFALYKISSKGINFIFLQHGVMYMVSLNSESRKMFSRDRIKGNYRVVVSGELEKRHFIELGNHGEQDIYVCGLPKYDRNILLPDADKIIIMPTWRPWELSEARIDFLSTPYYKMIKKIFDAVPDELKEKTVILPHPLIANEMKNIPRDMESRIALGVRYDDLLRQTRLLITDYSSIAYDAFYRGSRVIFYWEEKDFCMSKYGPSTRLMLNENNTFGDCFYSVEGLGEAITKNYNNPQREEYKNNYSKIVEFHDGKNTQRLLEFLKKDGII